MLPSTFYIISDESSIPLTLRVTPLGQANVLDNICFNKITSDYGKNIKTKF